MNQLTADKVYSVGSEGGKVETCYRAGAVQDIVNVGIFNEEDTNKQLDRGDIVFSDDFFYCTDLDRLLKFKDVPITPPDGYEAVEAVSEPVAETEAAPEPIATTEPEKPAKADKASKTLPDDMPADKLNGEVIVHIKKGTIGQFVIGEDGKEYFEYSEDSKGETKGRKPLKRKDFRLANSDEFWDNVGAIDQSIHAPKTEPAIQETALAKSEAPIEGELITGTPLSKTERKKLETLEAKYEEADSVERKVPFIKAGILDEIRKNQLFRETHNTFGEYALARFGITREYAQNLAQIAGIPALLKEAVDEGVEVALSVNTANALVRDGNKIAKALGLGKVEENLLAPVIRNTIALMVSVAPKDENGNPEITPRIVNEFNKVLSDHITDGVVTIDGENMTIKAASEKGLLSHSLRAEVMQGAAEGIKTNAETITNHFRKSFEEGNAPVNGNVAPLPDNTKYYKGKVPTLTIECSLHQETEITSISMGKLQTRCGCRFLIDNDSSELVAFEVNDLPVKRA